VPPTVIFAKYCVLERSLSDADPPAVEIDPRFRRLSTGELGGKVRVSILKPADGWIKLTIRREKSE
jgi:hypothetical protein